VISHRQETSQWPLLFDIATDIIAQTAEGAGREPEWSFGGGTALMLQIDHRESHDIDLFLSDPQFLPFLNPDTQGYALERMPDTYQTDGTGSLKLIYNGIGEIDFICCAEITALPTAKAVIESREVNLETPAEILAKKVFYRGAAMQPRDMFDIAATDEKLGEQYVLDALRQCSSERCEIAMKAAEKMNPKFATAIIGQLMYRDTVRHLVHEAQGRTIDLLKLALMH
jgi:hypothetical protein